MHTDMRRNRVVKLLPVFCAAFLAGIGATGAAKAAEPLEIARMTPSGDDVPAGREVVFQFNRDVVPLGRMERRADEVPVTFDPPLSCQWRWLNRSALACQLGEKDALHPATKYMAVVKPGIVAEDGAALAAEKSFSFITQRPKVENATFVGWAGPESPVLRVVFDQPVTKASVEKALSFVEKELANGKSGTRHGIVAEPEAGKSAEEASEKDVRRVWVVTVSGSLPADSDVALKVSPGLVSTQGSETGIEDAEILNFSTFPDFRLLGVRCYKRESFSDVFLSLSDLSGKDSAAICDPQKLIGLSFSVPVDNKAFQDSVKISPPLSKTKNSNPWASWSDFNSVTGAHSRGSDYVVWLPVWLDAETDYKFHADPVGASVSLKNFFLGRKASALVDFFGRPLARGMDLGFRPGPRASEILLSSRTSVQEKQISGDVPLFVQNLENVRAEFRTLTASGMGEKEEQTLSVPRDVRNLRFAIPLSVRGMLNGKSGAVRGTLYPTPQPGSNGSGASFFGQITPWAVHVKFGHHNSFVWVSDFKTGEPVKDAVVKIFHDSRDGFVSDRVPETEGKTDADGIAVLDGSAKIASAPNDEIWYAQVERDGDMALVPFDWNFDIGAYRVSDYAVGVMNRPLYGHVKAWGFSAQGVYRAGDTIQYKIYVRDQDNRKFVPASEGKYTLRIVDPTGLVVEEKKDLSLNAFGAIDGTYETPVTAKVGWYEFQLSSDLMTTEPISAMRVLVSDFTPAMFKVESSLDGDSFDPDRPVQVHVGATLHSGGPYDGAEIRVTGKLSPRPFESENPLLEGFYFQTGYNDPAQVFEKTARLDKAGEFTDSFTIAPPPGIVSGRLLVESAVRDDRGAYVSSYVSARYAGVDRLVGIRIPDSVSTAKKPFDIAYAVVDMTGNPVAGTSVSLSVERTDRKVARVRGPGNAYLAEISENRVKVKSCEGVSSDKPQSCVFTPEISGDYRVTATIKDTKGREHSTVQTFWVTGSDYVAWGDNNNYAVKIIPQQKELKVGDTARFLVENPFPGAKAFISVERFGVMRHWVRTFSTSTETVEFPVEADDVPGFYLSVVIFSPRAAPPPEDKSVDLGKPTFRMGYLSVPVIEPYKQIDVSAKVERDVYRPREKVHVHLNAAPKHPQGKEPIELAVVVLDESVLDLIQGGTNYYDPYKGFYALEPLDVDNYNIMMQLVGRQNIEKKGANAGGDGGASLSVRNLFKFVSYWNPSVPVNEKGEADIEFDAPDNLTGWRVLALAVTPGDKMGLGQAAFKVNRPTEIRPLTPNQILEGDSFTANFSVRNRTDKPRTLSVEIDAEGDIRDGSARSTQKLDLAPFSAQTVGLAVQASAVKNTGDVARGEIRFTARAYDESDEDGLAHSVPVLKRRTLVTAAEYGTTTENKVTESLSIPEKIHPDAGDVSVVLSPSVVGNIAGAFRYMKDYPYQCWEQKISKAVMAAQYDALHAYLPDDLKWDGTKALVEATLRDAPGFQAANGGMTYFGGDETYVDPYLSAYTALALTWLRADGYEVPSAFEQSLHVYLRTLLSDDVAPEYYTKAMASSVRAVALAALAGNGAATKDDLERYKPALDDMDLFGRAQYLRAALKVEEGKPYAAAALEKILAHVNQTGGKISFTETIDDSFTRILTSQLRSECAILDALADNPEPGKTDDLAVKLLRTITQARGNRDHWENTQENLFCMSAIAHYARKNETVKPSFTVTADIGGKDPGEAKFSDLRDPAKTLSRPLSAEDAGKKADVTLAREGAGRLYYAVRLRYAPSDDSAQAVNSGIEMRRELSVFHDGKWTLLPAAAKIRQGDLIRSDLYLSLPAARNFVVVEDPVPGGIEPINRDLATASATDADQAESTMAGGAYWFNFDDWMDYGVSRWSFYHSEIRHDVVRFYSDYLEPGNYHLSWTGRAIADGSFGAMPPRAEEMYDPDVFGIGLPVTLGVEK